MDKYENMGWMQPETASLRPRDSGNIRALSFGRGLRQLRYATCTWYSLLKDVVRKMLLHLHTFKDQVICWGTSINC
jgi:hypothetical protein